MPPAALALFYPSDTKHLDKCKAQRANALPDGRSQFKRHELALISLSYGRSLFMWLSISNHHIHLTPPSGRPHTHTGPVEDSPASSLCMMQLLPGHDHI